MRIIITDQNSGNIVEFSDELLDDANFVDITTLGQAPFTFSVDEVQAASQAFVTKRELMRDAGHNGLL